MFSSQHNRLFVFYSIFLIFTFTPLTTVQAQSTDIRYVKVNFDSDTCTTISGALFKLSRQIGVNIIYGNAFSGGHSFKRVIVKNTTVEATIRAISPPDIDLNIFLRNGEIILSKDISPVRLTGKVFDVNTNEVLIDAVVTTYRQGDTNTYNTGSQGEFSFVLERGEYKVQAVYLGYRTMEVTLQVRQKKNLQDFPLTPIPGSTMLSYVDIIDSTEKDNSQLLKQPEGSLQLRGLNKLLIPAPGGQNDLMQSIAENAGVLTGVDGLGGIQVRGGNSDQNLMLLDDVPVYNPSHALGIYSIFNTDAIKSAQLWKGDFPSRYGGRASSVIDIRTRDGNSKKISGGGNINLIGASVFIEGPLPKQKNKGSFAISARHSLIQPWANRFAPDSNILNISFDQLRYKFYDGNIKINQKFGEKNKISASFYLSGDQFSSPFSQKVTNPLGYYYQNQDTLASNWGNTISSIRWWHAWNNHLFANTTISYSHFHYQSHLRHITDKYDVNGRVTPISDYAQIYQSDIRDLAIRGDFSHTVGKTVNTSFGYSTIYHIFKPGALSINYLLPGQDSLIIDSLTNTLSKNRDYEAVESEVYGEATWLITPQWNCTAGVNASWFVTDNTVYKAFSPRLKLLHGPAIKTGWAQWIAYRQMVQYMHQIGSFNIGLPFELWVPSTQKVKPELVRQLSVGTKWSDTTWSVTAELYYKKMYNALVLMSSSRTLAAGGAEDGSGWEDRIARGQGMSKGFELVIAKKKGISQGYISYTLSKTERQFDDLNLGRSFPFQFDRPHNLKVFLLRDIKPWLNISAHWTYMSGNPITLALSKYTQNNTVIYYYKELNGHRLRPSHRLDVAANFSYIHKDKFSHKLQIGIYNLYNRYNPFYLITDAQSGQPNRAIEYTLLPITPTLRYALIF